MKAVEKKNLFIANLSGLQERRYGVSVKFFKSDEEQPHKRIDYEAAVQLQPAEKGWLIQLNKTKIYFNRHEPHLISERLGSRVAASIYPVQTVMNGWGQQTDGILNHRDILERWQTHKKEVREKYVGKTVEDFIRAVDQRLVNPNLIQRSMQYDLFWNLFFHPKYLSYTQTYQVRTELKLAVIPYKMPVTFAGTQEIIPRVTDYDAIRVKFRSDEQEAASGMDQQSGGQTRMRLEVDFDFDKTHHFAMHTQAKFELFRQTGRYTKLPIKKVQFTMFQL